MSYISRLRSFVAILFISVWPNITPLAQEKTFDEDTLKAVYSYKFALFADWPANKINGSGTNLKFCIIGKNPFSQATLDTIQEQPAKDRNMAIEIFNSGVLSEESLNRCHVAYISASETQRLPALLSAMKAFSILTISDISGFSRQGGMITLIKSGDHLKFEINLEAIQQASLALSSKIIELATVVKSASGRRN